MLTLDDDVNAIFERLAELEGRPKTKVIVEYLNAVRPHAEGLIQAMEAIQQNKNPMAVIDKMALDSLALIGEACTVTTATRAAAAKKYGDKDD